MYVFGAAGILLFVRRDEACLGALGARVGVSVFEKNLFVSS